MFWSLALHLDLSLPISVSKAVFVEFTFDNSDFRPSISSIPFSQRDLDSASCSIKSDL